MGTNSPQRLHSTMPLLHSAVGLSSGPGSGVENKVSNGVFSRPHGREARRRRGDAPTSRALLRYPLAYACGAARLDAVRIMCCLFT